MTHRFGRGNLSTLEPYRVHYEVGNEATVKLDANELPQCLIPGDLLARAARSLGLQRYPDPEASELVKEIAAYTAVDSKNILVGNGSDELLANICQCFFGCGVAFPKYTYPIYQHLASANEMRCVHLDMDDAFELHPSAATTLSTARPELVLLSYPNNPTGNCFDRARLHSMIEANPNTAFVLDEAYAEFSGDSFLDQATSRDNVIVLRTLSKAFGLAGLRVGYAIGRAPLLNMIRKVKLPYSVSALSQKIACLTMAEAKSSLLPAQ